MNKRFYYTRSTIYGWAVYDRENNSPAWDACAELLPPVYEGEMGKVTVDPCCESEFAAQSLCIKLNCEYKKRGMQL